jgi:opacity protein-like surface antigen
MRRAVLCLALLLCLPDRAAVHAQVAVTVDLNPEGEMLASQLGVTAQDLAARIQTRVNEIYGANNVDDYLRSFADATAFAMRGLGVDYASDPDSLILGVGVNFAVAASADVAAEERPTGGLAANLAFMAGYNLASQGAPRWTLYGNGFYRKASTEDLRGGITSLGLHAQYRVMNPQRDTGTATFLRWVGIDLTSGLEFTRWNLGVEDQIETSFGVQGSSGGTTLVLASMGTFDISSTAMTVPVEVSTGVRIALLVTMYVGAGVDFTLGSAKLSTDLAGTMRTTDDREVGTTTITGGGDNSASALSARVLAGLQLNLWKLRVYAQVNGSPTPAASVGFGIRGVL